MSENYFSAYEGNVDDLPTGDGFADGVYEVKIASIKDHKNTEKGSHGIMVNLECVDPDNAHFGTTHMWWINIPNPDKFNLNDPEEKGKLNRAYGRLKASILSLGVPADEVASFHATDDAAMVIGNYGTARIRTNGQFTNVDFKLDEDASPSDVPSNRPVTDSDTANTESDSSDAEDVDFSKFLSN